MANKSKRNGPGSSIHDPSSIANMQYNEKSGAQKQVDVGPRLLPIDGATKSTDGSTAKSIPAGKSLAIYNNSGTVAAILFGKTAAEVATVGAVGVVAANGEAAIPLKANDWTYLAAGENTFFKTSAATALCYIIDDETSIKAT